MKNCPICKLGFAIDSQGSPRCKVEHHCHLEDLLGHLCSIATPTIQAKRNKYAAQLAVISSRYHRFERTMICADCNSADKDLKALVGAQSLFSFAPEEIRKFLSRDGYGNRIIKEDVAKSIYETEKADFEKRLSDLRAEIQSFLITAP